MKRRLNLSQALVVPWEIPDINAAARKPTVPGFFEMPLGGEAEKGAAPTAMAAKTADAPKAAADAVSLQNRAEGFETGLREGRERGYADGMIAGRQAADLEFAEHLRRLSAVVQRLGEPMRSLERPVEEAVIALALEVSRWVIGSEVSRSRDFLLRLIREAVAKVPLDVGTPAIVLNPADVEVIRTLAPDLESHGVTLVPDEKMEAGGCRVIANGDEGVVAKDRRWHPQALQGLCEVDLTLASRWRDAMLTMFEGEDT